jgi:magnesium chelatase family protein
MLAKRIPTILPELTYEEKLEITGIYSVAGLLTEEEQIIENRPFRNPHNSISVVNMIGGGRKPEPGELSLAHNGVIFLDEFGEFNPAVIDAMRQPVEEGVVRITRSFEEMIFPAQVLVVAAANPCKCGNLWDEKKR